MHTYPLDSKTKDGKLFWWLQKRPPTALEFNVNDPIHSPFIYPIYCFRGIAEAFSRMCAVYGRTFMVNIEIVFIKKKIFYLKYL